MIRPTAHVAAVLLLATVWACAPAVVEHRPREVATESRVDPDTLDLRADDIQRQVRNATMRVRNRRCFGLGTGSGVVVAPHLLVTNRHVVEGADVLQVSTWDGRSLEVSVNGYALSDDLALVDTVEPLPQELEMEEVRPTVGDPVVAVGYPEGGAITFSDGRVVDYVPGAVFGQSARTMRVTSDVTHGNSGGPLVDTRGQVVGIVFGVETDTGHGLVIPADVLLDVADTQGFFLNPSPC